MNRFRVIIAAAVVLGTSVPATARAQHVWDFAQLVGSNSSNLGNSYTFTLGAYGSVTAFTFSDLFLASYDVTSSGYNSPLPNATKGIGVRSCALVVICNSAQIGGSDELWLDLSGLAPTQTPISLTLASVNQGDVWAVDFANPGTCSVNTSFAGSPSPFSGTSSPTTPYVTLAIPALMHCVHFGGGSGSYVLQSMLTNDVVGGVGTQVAVTPEPASMVLLASGLVGMVAAGRRKRRKVS